MLAETLFLRSKHPACFSLSTKDRTGHTLEAISAIGSEGGFDLLWFDGSRTDDGRALPHRLAPHLHCLREIHLDVVGGPDFAIFPALARMLALGYEYCGLIENDVKLSPGWFATLMRLFDAGRDDGLAVGAVAPLAFPRWVLYRRDSYAVTEVSGATAVLFTREAAQLIIDHYRTTTAGELATWMAHISGKDLTAPAADTRVSSDLIYNMTLQKHGLAVLGAVPPRARLLDGEQLARTNLGGYCEPDDSAAARDAEGFAGLVERLRERRARQGDAAALPYLFMPSMDFWYVFAHQLLYSPGTPARLRGHWRFVWEKFDGPFALEACEPGVELIVPFHGALRGVFCAHGSAAGAFDVMQGTATLAEYDCRRQIGGMQQFYAALDIVADGDEPIRVRARGSLGSVLRISGLCFGDLPSWLPRAGALDVPALAAALAASGYDGFIPTAGAPVAMPV